MQVDMLTHGKHCPRTGIGRYVHEVRRRLSKMVDVRLCALQYLPLASRVSLLKQLPIGIRRHRPSSIVHFPQIMGCAMMLWRPNHPSVATVHDLGVLELPEEWAMLDPMARQMLRLSLAGLKRVDKVIADSEFTRQGVIKHLEIPPERVVTIHLGIDHDVFRPIPNARHELLQRYPELQPHAATPWLLYVGSELPRKNLGTLLKVLALVRHNIPDVRLIKVGSAGGDPYRKETLRVVNELRLGENVFFFEGIAEDELPFFYSASDLFVTASKLEGFGFPILEAMACGTPVELMHPVGIVFEYHAYSAQRWLESHVVFADRILNALLNTSGNGEAHREILINSSDFTWTKTIDQLVQVYCELTSPHLDFT